MDANHETMIEAVRKHKLDDLVCPEYLHDALSGMGVSKSLVPYCGALSVDFGPDFGVLIHKGMLHRLSFPVLEAMLAKLEPVFANEVFVLLRAGSGEVNGGQTESEIAAHVSPILDFQRSWGAALHPKSSTKKATIISAWHVGNVGDDVVTLSAEHICREAGYDEVVFLGPNGNYDEIRNSDLVAIGGGGLIYDGDWENVSNYTAPAVFAKHLRIPTAVLGVGTQGIRKNLSAQVYREAFKDAALVTVRDEFDVTVMRDQCDIRSVVKTADLAFALPNDLWRGDQSVLETKRAGRRLAVISLSKLLDETTGRDGYAHSLCVNTATYVKSRDYEVIFAQHSLDDDDLYAAVTSEIQCERVLLADCGVRDAIELYRSADLAITSRFHGVIFSSLAATPVAIACSRAGKTGRLVEHDLLSLRDAAMFVSKDNASTEVNTWIESACTALDSEVMACRAEALKNIDYLRAAIRKHEDKVNPRANSEVEASARGNRNDGVASALIGPRTQAILEEDDWFKSAQACLIEIASRKGASTKKINLVDFDFSDRSFEEAVRSSLGDKANLTNADIRSLNTEQHSRVESDVALAKLDSITPGDFRMITRGFNCPAILVKTWSRMSLSESDIQTISIEAALRDYSIFSIKNEEISHLPIYALPEFSGPIAFFPKINRSRDTSINWFGNSIVAAKLFLKRLVRKLRQL